MQIREMKVNHLSEPIGFLLDGLTFSWIADSDGIKQQYAQLQIAANPDFSALTYDSGKRADITGIGFSPQIKLVPRTRYWWRVFVAAENGDFACSEVSFFETGKMEEPWSAEWIAAPFSKARDPLFQTSFRAENVLSARLYCCGLGVYEVYCNGCRVGEELLMPGSHAYDFWQQYQTYDIGRYLQEGENTISFLMGRGWYCGSFGYDDFVENYGDRCRLICEIHLLHSDGNQTVLKSGKHWVCCPSPITHDDIYYGEDYDASLMPADWCKPIAIPENWCCAVCTEDGTDQLTARLSPPVIRHESFQPTLLHTPAGENVLDFGQNFAGWVEFDCNLPRGATIVLQYGELLQQGCFYRENLRSAQARFSFRSDGKRQHVRPHVTYFGFRYVCVTGVETIHPEDFTAYAIYSDLPQTGDVTTSMTQVNQLMQNIRWGQKSNFLDVPTDCPQRDERLGWTGDAQIFSGTACFQMETAAFYTKYLFDLRKEQQALCGGIPFVAPCVKQSKDNRSLIRDHSSSAWGDAATIIPWILYLYYGDKRLLRQHYPMMRDWVEYILRQPGAQESGLWQTGFHFGDWLALDHGDSFAGRTDIDYIASCFFAQSAILTAKAASELEISCDARKYAALNQKICNAIKQKWFDAEGHCKIDTQTALAIALQMEIAPEYDHVLAGDLAAMLKQNQMHLTTGFVGTPFLCRALSDHGRHAEACELFLQPDYPGWLYEVAMGATTVWERWNSIMPNGAVSDTGMNSMNHYAYGAVGEWVYRNLCGIKPDEGAPGFQTAMIAPQPDVHFQFARAAYRSQAGTFLSEWKYEADDVLYRIQIPFQAQAKLRLPGWEQEQLLSAGQYEFRQNSKNFIKTK